MARLPVPGGDVDAWAALLNEYLLIAHNPDGTQRFNSIPPHSVELRDLDVINPANQPLADLVLTNDNTRLAWRDVGEVLRAGSRLRLNVHDFGAKGDGVTDDTAAIQAAIDSADTGGIIEIPRGTYMVRGLKIKKFGTTLAGEARWGTRLVRISGTAPLVDVSGTASMTGHIRYCTIMSLTLNGGHAPGPLVRSYYADSCTYQDVHFVYCEGFSTDLIEAWDTRFTQCIWENCGTETEAAVLLRNTMPVGQFGYSDDNTNQIYFTGCRWESFRNGAIKLDGAANGSPRMLNGVFFTSCKMETRFCAGPVIQIMPNTTIVFVNQLYIAIMAALPSTVKPLDAIDDAGSHIFMTDVYVQWGFEVQLANSLVHVRRSGPHMYYKLSTFYPTGDPIEAAIIAEPGSFDVIVSCNVTNRGRLTKGDVSTVMIQSPKDGVEVPLDASGVFVVSSRINNKDLVKVDNTGTRPALNMANATDITGYSDNYATEKWRIVGASGAARFAGSKFQIDGAKGHVGINTAPFAGIAMLIKTAADGDRGLAIVRSSSSATNRLMEFQDETFAVQGMAIDSGGRPIAVGTPAQVTAGTQVSYANPNPQVRDIAGTIQAAVRPTPTAPGTIARITFSRPYASTPLNITITNQSAAPAELYVSARSTTSFTVSTRSALPGGSILKFDYSVIA